MLALAIEVLAFGAGNASRHELAPGIAVEAPSTPGHVIT